MDLRKYRKVSLVLLIVMLVLSVIGKFTSSVVLALAVIGLFVAYLILDSSCNRCPKCNKYLGRRSSGDSYCRHCGEKLP